MYIEPIFASGTRKRQWLELLARAGLTADGHLQYTVGLFNDDDRLLATGSAFEDTLRCLAVDGSARGEGYLNQIVSHLIAWQASRGRTRLFLYTKPDTAYLMESLGFHEIERVPGTLVFMENRPGAFDAYLRALLLQASEKPCASIVMNANPFTKGHLHLVQRALTDYARVELFVLSEDVSLIPFADRMEMVRRGCEGLKGVVVRPSGRYIVSAATFPSYFLKEDELVTRTHARLDARVFAHIARALNIAVRYVGTEPFSTATRIYNEELRAILPQGGVQVAEIPRAAVNGMAVSASEVRAMIHEGLLENAKDYLPPSTYAYLSGASGASAISAIRASENVRHE